MRYTAAPMRFIPLCFLLVFPGAFAQAEIHRCPQPDGTVSFQETPCPDPAPDSADDTADDEPTPAEAVGSDDFFDFVNPYDQPANENTAPDTSVDLPAEISRSREVCEKTTRDAIDAIDLEMRETSYTKEEGDAYLARLLELTEQLRACKQL